MTDWSDGYVTDIDYTHGYYPELNPLRIILLLLNQRISPPNIHTACELGFGQGLSINIHSAASETKWYGTDFNPSQAQFARELSVASGADVTLADDSFEEYLQRNDLPSFDFIGLHGIWSWVSDQNRSAIAKFIHKKLNIGGVIYISYNTQPGWTDFAPIRHMMREFADRTSTPSTPVSEKIETSLKFQKLLIESEPQFIKRNPQAVERLNKLEYQNQKYIAHEYFNKDWRPMYFSEVSAILESAKVQFACSANPLDHLDVANFNIKQQEILAGIRDQHLRQSVRDFIVNQKFRRDYWIRGVRKLSILEQAEKLRSLRIVMVVMREEVRLTMNTIGGSINLNPDIYHPILDILEDGLPKFVHEIEEAVTSHGIELSQLLEVILVLSGGGYLALAHKEEEIKNAENKCLLLNRHLCKKAQSDVDISHLASPVTGGGVSVNRISQLFLYELSEGNRDTNSLAERAWLHIKANNQKLIRDGLVLETDEANLNDLRSRAAAFLRCELPILRRLKVYC